MNFLTRCLSSISFLAKFQAQGSENRIFRGVWRLLVTVARVSVDEINDGVLVFAELGKKIQQSPSRCPLMSERRPSLGISQWLSSLHQWARVVPLRKIHPSTA